MYHASEDIHNALNCRSYEKADKIKAGLYRPNTNPAIQAVASGDA